MYFRHWVKTTCRALSDPALAALQGHKAPNRGMRNVYDNPENDDLFAEQSRAFPLGPVDVFATAAVQADWLSSDEESAIREFKAGKLGPLGLAQRLEALQRASFATRVRVEP